MRLSTLEKFAELDHVPLLVPHSLRRFQRESLACAGVDATRLVGLPPGRWRTDRLFFPELLGPTGNPSPHAIDWLRQRFARFMSPERPGRRLYMTRRDTRRTVTNPAEIADYLRNEGFEVICAGDLSLAEQIKVFSEAAVVLAPHGAALTNMTFAPAEATVIEFFGDNYINGCFWALANIRRQKHAFIIGRTRTLDYSVPLEEVKTLVGRLCSTGALV